MIAKPKPPAFRKSSLETRPSVLHQSAISKLPNRLSARGEVLLPAIPSLVDHYVHGLHATWLAFGRKFSEAELEELTQVLGNLLQEAFDASPFSRVSVAYETDPPPNTSLTWHIEIRPSTIEEEYADWVASRTPPLFGSEPDAKVMDLARSLGTPSEVVVLDVGAGTGRNTLALANVGFQIDAVEIAPALAKILRQDLESAKLVAKVYECSIFNPMVEFPTGHYDFVFLSEVVSHFRSSEQIRYLFEAADRLLKPNGTLLFNSFTTLGDYEPEASVRQISEVMWCHIFPRREIQEAAAGLPFVLVSEESTLEYEKSHHPPEQWPPTGWYESWSSGQDMFDLHASQVPVELRWFVYRKLASP